MIIKNNFNEKNVNPLNDYTGVGKGSHSLDKELDDERKGLIKENMDNPILRELCDNQDESDNQDGDNWKFFR